MFPLKANCHYQDHQVMELSRRFLKLKESSPGTSDFRNATLSSSPTIIRFKRLSLSRHSKKNLYHNRKTFLLTFYERKLATSNLSINLSFLISLIKVPVTLVTVHPGMVVL